MVERMDYLKNPLEVIRSLFAKAIPNGESDVPLSLSRSDWGVKELFGKCLFEEGAISQVPEINTVLLDSIPSNSLVRFHGMVQDMLDVEYYIGIHKDGNVWDTHKYTDKAISQEFHDSDHQIWERRLLYCVPVPGENAWVKRARFVPIEVPECPSSPVGESLKRQREPLSSEVESMDFDAPLEATGEHKRMRTTEPQQADLSPKGQLGFGMAGEESRLFSCLVKMYDGCDANLKLNDIAEFIGVLTFDPTIAPQGLSSVSVSETFMQDDISLQLPASKVPRLHCITLRKLSAYSVVRPDPLCNMSLSREFLLLHLQNVLGEDRLAAEYLLLHLLSKVHNRVEPVAIGKLSLNFSGCQGGLEGALSPLAASIAKSISMLLPCSQVLALSLHNLNSSSFAPRKDYDSNRLITGPLQLAASTHLMLDETALNTGRLNETGVQNLRILENVIRNQKVEYDFHYYNLEMTADLPVLVLSTGKSRLLPADALVPLRPSPAQPVQMDAPEEGVLSNWRTYLSSVREAAHVIEPSMQKILEDDLVAARQRDRTIGPDTFHKWLTMARLASLSFGERSLTMERWHMVKELEMSCAARISA